MHVVAAAQQPVLLRSEPHEADAVGQRPQPRLQHAVHGQRHRQVGSRAAAVIVDAGAGHHAVQVRADDDGGGDVTRLRVRDDVGHRSRAGRGESQRHGHTEAAACLSRLHEADADVVCDDKDGDGSVARHGLRGQDGAGRLVIADDEPGCLADDGQLRLTHERAVQVASLSQGDAADEAADAAPVLLAAAAVGYDDERGVVVVESPHAAVGDGDKVHAVLPADLLLSSCVLRQQAGVLHDPGLHCEVLASDGEVGARLQQIGHVVH